MVRPQFPALAAPLPESAGPPAPGWSLIESFVDAQGAPIAATPRGAQPAATKVSYFRGGDASRYRTGIDTYDQVNLGDVFVGVNENRGPRLTAGKGARGNKPWSVPDFLTMSTFR